MKFKLFLGNYQIVFIEDRYSIFRKVKVRLATQFKINFGFYYFRRALFDILYLIKSHLKYKEKFE